MKKLKTLKLRDIVDTTLNVSEMGDLKAGVNSNAMSRAYGCYSFVCKDDKTASQEKCTVDTCYMFTCQSGA